MARILLIGGAGLLGSAVARAFANERHELCRLDRGRFDIAAARWPALDVAGHDWVLNAAGIVKSRGASAAEMWTVNAVFPHVLARECERGGARLIHVSTDCVFDGIAGCYDEASDAPASDGYGGSKRAGEPEGALVLRTSFIGPEPPPGRGLLGWCLRQTAIDGYVDHRWNGVTSPALATAIRRIVDDDGFVAGVRHVHGEDTTKHALLALIRRAFGHPAPIAAVAAPAPRDTRLRTRHPEFLAALRQPPLAEQVADLAARATPLGDWRAA